MNSIIDNQIITYKVWYIIELSYFIMRHKLNLEDIEYCKKFLNQVSMTGFPTGAYHVLLGA